MSVHEELDPLDSNEKVEQEKTAVRNNEYSIKKAMAQRLNDLLVLDPTLVTTYMRTMYVVKPELGVKSNFEVDVIGERSASIAMLGLLNGLVGENYFSIKPIYDGKAVIGFDLHESNPSTFITVNTQQEQIDLQEEDNVNKA